MGGGARSLLLADLVIVVFFWKTHTCVELALRRRVRPEVGRAVWRRRAGAGGPRAGTLRGAGRADGGGEGRRHRLHLPVPAQRWCGGRRRRVKGFGGIAAEVSAFNDSKPFWWPLRERGWFCLLSAVYAGRFPSINPPPIKPPRPRNEIPPKSPSSGFSTNHQKRRIIFWQ